MKKSKAAISYFYAAEATRAFATTPFACIGAPVCVYDPPVRGTTDDTELRSAPVGAWRAGDGFVWFCPRPTLCGFAVWGRPDDEAMRRLGALLEIELGPPVPPHASLVDASRLEGVDARAFERLAGHVTAHFSALARQVTRLAIVRPSGLVGATVSGFFQVLERPYPVEIFGDASSALAWLSPGSPNGGHDEDAAFLAELDAIIAGAAGLPPVLVAVRRLLDARLTELSPIRAAQALGMSLRSFQRQLHAADTTFQVELNRAQIRAAQRLLLDSDASLTTVALDIGCASPQHFSSLFRRLVGESPSTWRARHRPSP
jgi:AraC-like DNA-binding protein